MRGVASAEEICYALQFKVPKKWQPEQVVQKKPTYRDLWSN